MDVIIKGAKLWTNERKRRDGTTWNDYTISVSKKTEAGEFINCGIRVRFTKDVNVPANLPNGYEIASMKGFFSVEAYTDRNDLEVRKPMLIIQEVPQWNEGAEFGYETIEEDVPF